MRGADVRGEHFRAENLDNHDGGAGRSGGVVEVTSQPGGHRLAVRSGGLFFHAHVLLSFRAGGNHRPRKTSLQMRAASAIHLAMLAKVCSAAVNGIEAYPVEVEVNAGWGDTLIVIVGLPDAAVKESRDRVTTALSNSGFKFPMGLTTINLAPADVKKEGPSFDLPIAVGLLAASDQCNSNHIEDFIMVGELALTGAVRSVKGMLQIALRARAEKKAGLLVPVDNAAEAGVVKGLQVIAIRNLREAVDFLEERALLKPVDVDLTRIFDQPVEDDVDFAEVKGQESVKRAL